MSRNLLIGGFFVRVEPTQGKQFLRHGKSDEAKHLGDQRERNRWNFRFLSLLPDFHGWDVGPPTSTV
jgi:hypothetical protein